MVPVVYAAKRTPTIYHIDQNCHHALRIKVLQAISLTAAMAGWWQPPGTHAGGNTDIQPVRPCYDCHKNVWAAYWNCFDIRDHPYACSLLPKKRPLLNTDSSADSDDSSITSSSDVITVVEAQAEDDQANADIEFGREASEDSGPFVLDADLGSDSPGR